MTESPTINGASNQFSVSGYMTVDGVTMPILERDALNSTPETPPIRDHPAHEVKSFVATPQINQTMLQKIRAAVMREERLDTPLVFKSAEGLRYMFLITSNSYQDRDGETITSDALKAYEASCYPGEDLFVCDNPLLWWHDDEIVMGEIVAVDYAEPFLIEMAKEIHDPLAKILWDFAEQNGDDAGTSHRFGYLDKDRDEDGTFHRIFKQETSYLPERSLAANDKTYAGVLAPMSIPESRKRLAEVVGEATGQDLTDLIYTNLAAAKKKLSDIGLSHKAFPPAAKKPASPPAMEADAAAVDTAAVAEEDAVMEDETAAEEVSDGKVDITRLMVLMNGMLDMFANMLDNEAMGQEERVGMMKAFDELKEMRMSEKAQDSTTIVALTEKLKALETRQAAIEARLNLAPKSVTMERGQTPLEMEVSANALVNTLKQVNNGEKKVDPIFGVEIDPSKIPNYGK